MAVTLDLLDRQLLERKIDRDMINHIHPERLFHLVSAYRPKNEHDNIDDLLSLKSDGISKLRCIAEHYHMKLSCSMETRYNPAEFRDWWRDGAISLSAFTGKMEYLKNKIASFPE